MKRSCQLLLGTGLLALAGCEGPATPPPVSNVPAPQPATVIAYNPPSAHSASDVYATVPIDSGAPELLVWLNAQKVRLEKDANGDARVYDTPECRRALVQYRRLLVLKASVTAENLANATISHDDRGELNTYRRKFVSYDANGNVEIKSDPSPSREAYEPQNPDADAKGNVKYPNIDPTTEKANSLAIAREYNQVTYILSRFDPSYAQPDPISSHPPVQSLQSQADSH